MLKIKIAAGGNAFEFETDAALSEVTKYLDLWFGAIAGDEPVQQQINKLTARVRAANDSLESAVNRNTPSST